MVPYTLDQHNQREGVQSSIDDLGVLYWGIIAEIPTMFVAWWAADSSLGRKNSLILFFFLTAVPLGILLFVGMKYLILLTALAKFAIAVCFILIYSYTLEIYDTSNRVTALGVTGGVGRVGGITFPIFLLYASEYWMLGPYFILFALSFLTFIVDFQLPYETKDRDLDRIVA